MSNPQSHSGPAGEIPPNAVVMAGLRCELGYPFNAATRRKRLRWQFGQPYDVKEVRTRYTMSMAQTLV